MTSTSEEKPKYFANGDFEKTVADIISSPRRCKPFVGNTEHSLFEISDKQKEYYTKCFRHLLKTTQNVISVLSNSALNGADFQVVDFFKKSGLDTESLSKIWALSDVNEDGWLDLNEFSVAMHLIVLKVKGEVPIPSSLPPHVRPPMTPSRSNSQMQGQISPAVPASSSGIVYPLQSSKTSLANSWDQFDLPDNIAPSTNKEDAPLAQFSDVPPLLVDSRPTAVKPSVASLLALKSPSGPPPQPPPRPLQKGHNRSASLDLKIVTQPNSFTTFPAAERRDSDSTVFHNSSMTSAPSGTVTRSAFTGKAPIVIPPPVPQRTSPGTSLKSVETQTEKNVVDKEELDKFISTIGSTLENINIDEMSVEGVDQWELKCKALRLQNLELERERARLAQARTQLELRLQELQLNQSSKSNTSKPTAL